MSATQFLSHPFIERVRLASHRKIFSNSLQVLLVMGLLVVLPAVQARDFASRPVKIIVPTSAGSGADIAARLLAPRMTEMWGQPVVIDNQAGASGNIGASMVASAAPDGHTLLMMTVNNAVNTGLFPNMPFDIQRDFKPIANIVNAPLVIVAHPTFPANTLQELIALARSRPQPNAYFFASSGTGSLVGLAFEMLKQKANIELTQTPYKGTAQMLTDVMANQVPLSVPAVATALQNIKSGKLKALAVTTKSRSSNLPNVPTVSEAGIPGFDVAGWNGIVAPAATPDAVIAEIYEGIVKITSSREFTEQVQQQGLDLAMMNPAEFRRHIANEVSRWAQLIKETGARAN